MSFNIPRTQQKLFIENFMQQALTLSCQLAEQGKDRGSPGETLHRVGLAIINHLRKPAAESEGGDE